jgi:hypothetical protein
MKKLPRAVAEELLSSGFLSKEKFEEMLATGRITSGAGGGKNPVADQLVAAGVPRKLIDKLYAVLDEVNGVLWKGNTYAGKVIRHKDKKGVEHDVMLEAAIWAKHHVVEAAKEEAKK